MTTLLRSKVGPKGQAVIPKAVRDALGIRPGDEVTFTVHAGHAHVEKADAASHAKAIREFFANLPRRGPGGERVTARELRRIRDEQYEA